MDFSRQGVAKKRKELKSVAKRLNSKFWIIVFRFLIIGVVAVAIFAVTAGLGAFNGLIDSAPAVPLGDLEVSGYTSTAYYTDGTVSQIFIGENTNRVYVDIENIPEYVQKAFVAMEDKRFYQHKGVDFRTLMRAGYSFVDSGFTQGASTLTQQLLKDRVFGGGQEKTKLEKIVRKVQEQYLAVNLEHVMSKDKILEYYMNLVNLGNGCYGVETAAEGYFDKTVDQLTLSEAAVLAPIALSPTRQNPITYPTANAARRRKCLDTMLEEKFITQQEYDEAMADDVYTRIAEVQKNKKKAVMGQYSYFTEAMKEELYKDFETELGLTREEAYDLLSRGGLSIYTTQDREIQEIVDRYYTDESNFPEFGFGSSQGSCYLLSNASAISIHHEDETVTNYSRNQIIKYFADYVDSAGYYYHEDGTKKGISEYLLSEEDITAKFEEFAEAHKVETDIWVDMNIDLVPQPQSSMTIMDQSNGQVVAMYGGRGKKKGNLVTNRAYEPLRNGGSTFKVVASFLPAVDAGGLTLASVQDDSPYFYPNSTKQVYNWYNTGFRGLQSLRTGIANSLNIVAVKTLEQIGTQLGYEYLEKLGFSTLDRDKDSGNVSMALGAITNGVKNIDMTAAYAAIANEGKYNKPIYYTKVLDHDGNVLIDHTVTHPSYVMKASTAWLITDAMLDTTTVGTGKRLAFRNYNMPVAGKTGTASKNYDLWFAGFTPYYTCSVWTGYDYQFNQKNKSYQQDLWRNIMEEVHRTKQLEYKTWEMPDSIQKATICTKCGKLAVTGLCDEAEGGSCVSTEYFAKGTVPTQKCTCHIRVNICKSSKKLATPNCPEKKVKSVVLLVKSEDYSKYDGYPGYSSGCNVGTWDSAYVYKPEETCLKHNKPGTDDTEDVVPDDELYEDAHQMGGEDDVFDDSFTEE